jgi:hypothetical protein
VPGQDPGTTEAFDLRKLGELASPSTTADQVEPCRRRAEIEEAPLSEDLEDLRDRFNENIDLVRVVAITAPG